MIVIAIFFGILFYLGGGYIVANVASDNFYRSSQGGIYNKIMPSTTLLLIMVLWPIWLIWQFLIHALKLINVSL